MVAGTYHFGKNGYGYLNTHSLFRDFANFSLQAKEGVKIRAIELGHDRHELNLNGLLIKKKAQAYYVPIFLLFRRGVDFVRHLSPNRLLKQLSTECRKTKAKVITLANHKGHRAIP